MAKQKKTSVSLVKAKKNRNAVSNAQRSNTKQKIHESGLEKETENYTDQLLTDESDTEGETQNKIQKIDSAYFSIGSQNSCSQTQVNNNLIEKFYKCK